VYIDRKTQSNKNHSRRLIEKEKKNCTGTLEATFGTKETLYGSSPNGLLVLLLLLLLSPPPSFFFLLASHLIPFSFWIYSDFIFKFLPLSFNKVISLKK
jgi:hypothetical protein